jgi:thymidylate synthase (FAD)
MTQEHSAKLIWITPEAENVISYCARVSNPANQDNYDTAPKLLQYCIKHGHWSIFEMASMCVEINTTRSIAAQILRHRSFSFQEFSQRYALISAEPQVPALRRQDTKNRQNSIDDLDKEVELDYRVTINDHFQKSVELYLNLVESGVAKECAREVLPLATPTRLYMSGTIRSWLHYCKLRTGNGTQLEHSLIAEQILGILGNQVPNVTAAMFYD